MRKRDNRGQITDPAGGRAPALPVNIWGCGDTRTMKCSCGDSKGVTETNYGGHWGYFDSGMASSLFNECNDSRGDAQYVERDPLGNIIYAGVVHPVSRDGSLDNLAERRATEVLSNWSHQGRDLDSYYTTENLAKGFNSAVDVRCAWAASHDHAGTMVYQYYKSRSCMVLMGC